MPQVDKVTFLPSVFWIFIFYVGGFIVLCSTSLFTFLSNAKLLSKRSVLQRTGSLLRGAYVSTLSVYT